MKKTLTTLGMGACVLLAFNSCQSIDGDGYYGSEEAVPMSEMTVADGEIPPWLLEDTGDIQVDAGATTHNPNTFPIPEPGEGMEDHGGRASAGQNQPGLADANDVTIETNEDDIIVAPFESATSPVMAPEAPVAQTPVAPRETASSGALKTATASSRKTTSSKTKPKAKKPAKRVTEPTLVSYKVKPGDNLSEIARRSNTTMAAIRKASGIKGDTIYAGSTIKVPFTPNSYKMAQAEKSAKATTHTVKSGESLSKIAAKNGLTTQELLKANNMTLKQANNIKAGQKLTIPGKAGSSKAKSSSAGSSTKAGTHTVKRGETLSAIAAKYGVTTQALLKANGMTAKQASRIRPGQKLTIPGKAGSSKAKSGKKSKKKNRR